MVVPLVKADSTKLIKKSGQTVFQSLKGIIYHGSTDKDPEKSAVIQSIKKALMRTDGHAYPFFYIISCGDCNRADGKDQLKLVFLNQRNL